MKKVINVYLDESVFDELEETRKRFGANRSGFINETLRAALPILRGKGITETTNDTEGV